MILAAVVPAKDLGVVKLLLITSQFHWQVMACNDKFPTDLLPQDWTLSPSASPLQVAYPPAKRSTIIP